MPNFEEFARGAPRDSGREAPMFTLQARGLLSLNHAAFRTLGEPEAVTLLYDADEHIVGLRRSAMTDPNAYRVRKQQPAQSYLVGAQAFTAHYGIPTPRARRFEGIDYGDGIWGFALSRGVDVKNLRGSSAPEPVLTDRWRHTTDGAEVPSLMRITHQAFSHPAYLRGHPDQPASVRIGALVACDPLGPEPTSSDLRSRFGAFLASPQPLGIVSELSHIDTEARWTSLAGNGRLMLEAALMTEDQDQAPVASAMLLLPEPGRPRFGSDPRYAEFVLHIEPRTPDRTPVPPPPLLHWRDRFAQALALPAALARFLTSTLDLATTAEPPAELGIWLNAPRSLNELVDTRGLKTLPGSALVNGFVSYVIADPAGKPATSAATDILSQMCDFTFHLDGWESVIRTEIAGNQRTSQRASTTPPES
jgi:hypothetical protein